MRYTTRKTRGRCRPLAHADRKKRRAYNTRTKRHLKLWEKEHVKKPKVTLNVTGTSAAARDAREAAAAMASMLKRK